MQEEIEKQKRKLRALKLLLAQLEAERERLQHDVYTLRSSLPADNSTPVTSKSSWHRYSVPAVSLLAVAALLSIDVFHSAFSNVKNINMAKNQTKQKIAPSSNNSFLAIIKEASLNEDIRNMDHGR